MVYPTVKKFDPLIVKNIHINKNSVEAQVQAILQRNKVSSKDLLAAWLLRAISVIDLTTLSGDDTPSNVKRLCIKAAYPLTANTIKTVEGQKIRTAAVCVYPSRVQDAYSTIRRMGLVNELPVASVATGFPSGLYPLNSRLDEIKMAVSNGAKEIDIVLDRSLVLRGKWEELFNEVITMKEACGEAHMKVILGVGELGTYENVYKASMVSMFAGADFIKTSTGKEAVNATLPVGLIMCRAIRRYYKMTNKKVGLKPAGGIKTATDAVNWLVLVNNELGPEWLSPKLFRIGASSLLDVLEKSLNLH
ncbi:deoxyribose-phosphate aldolase [Plodia interpunctella]|uniref:deoxyribose-phosphate aldolase n=1 Tax=Plodia interpunctella TaxID=58824 RepID=UPI0023677F20|nr:deoxyribose-phosphate aldolase [Plodia interpunctella]